MKRIILFYFFSLGYLGLTAQNGNVGIGTTSPQAKLHVSGDLRLEDNLEIKDSMDVTIFTMNPNAKAFEIYDESGNPFYRVGIENTTTNLVAKNNNGQRSSTPEDPLINIVRTELGEVETTTRRPDGSIESIRSVGNTGIIETRFNPNGVIQSQTIFNTVLFPFTGTTEFNSEGVATRQIIKGPDGSFSETFLQADGETIKSRITYEASPSNKVIKEKFDENGALVDKEVSESSFTNFFDKDENLVSSMELQNGYFQTIFDSQNGNSNMSYAMGNTIEDSNSGDRTDVYAGSVNVEKDGKELHLNNVGFEVGDTNDIPSFFVDQFGISKFEASLFTGIDFNTTSESTDVFGDLNVFGTISKTAGTFKIDHPLDPKNKFLYHSFVESPDMMNVYNGNIITDENGEAIVKLPSYFEALNKDFRYQLTVIGSFAQAIVWEKVQNNQFTIKTDEPTIEVSWQVTGIRNDEYAKANRVKVEMDKQGSDKGKLLYDPNRVGPYSENMKKHWDRTKGKK